MRKSIIILVMVIFLISILQLTLAAGEKLREKLNEINKQGAEKLKELREKPEFVKYNNTLGFKARVLERMHVEQAKENYIKARERYELAKANLEQAKLKFNEQIALRKACQNNTEECNQTEEQLRLRAKEFLGNSADTITEHLNKLKSKIQENEDLSQEEASAMIARIDAKITEIGGAKEQAQTATTKEEIVEAAKKINAAWKNVKEETVAETSEMTNARIGGIIVKSQHLEEKLAKTLARMEDNGKNVDDIKPMIDGFDEKIKIAEQKYEAATERFKEFWMVSAESNEKLREAQELMQEAKNALKDANGKLREIIKAIKEKNGQKEMDEENKEEQANENITAS